MSHSTIMSTRFFFYLLAFETMNMIIGNWGFAVHVSYCGRLIDPLCGPPACTAVIIVVLLLFNISYRMDQQLGPKLVHASNYCMVIFEKSICLRAQV
jgi:hypothetical protein